MILFPFYQTHMILPYHQIILFLNYFPSFTFFSAYLLVLFCWARIYHNKYEVRNGLKFDRLRLVFSAITIVVYAVLAAIFVIDLTMYPLEPVEGKQPLSSVVGTYIAVLYLISSSGFAVYAVLISQKMRRLSLDPARSSISKKIHRFTLVIVIVLLLRVLLVLLDSVFDIANDSLVQPLYYILLELVPLAIMIHILKMDSRYTRKESPLLLTNPSGYS